MTPDQCRQARELLGWTEVQLANRAGIKPTTVRYVEGPHGRPKPRSLFAIRIAIEAAGVEFIIENGGEVKVRLRGKPG